MVVVVRFLVLKLELSLNLELPLDFVLCLRFVPVLELPLVLKLELDLVVGRLIGVNVGNVSVGRFREGTEGTVGTENTCSMTVSFSL